MIVNVTRSPISPECSMARSLGCWYCAYSTSRRTRSGIGRDGVESRRNISSSARNSLGVGEILSAGTVMARDFFGVLFETAVGSVLSWTGTMGSQSGRLGVPFARPPHFL